jgi:hypothetical protein
MAAYLLTCTCGNTIPVEIGQAGGQVKCTCGKSVDVPPLRQLRHLPQQQSEPKPERKAANWGTRQGWITASLIAAAILLGWSAWSWFKDPPIPVFDPKARMASVEQQIKTPTGAWESWIGFYKPMAEHGLPVFQPANAHLVYQEIASRQFFRRMLWSIAGLLGLAAMSGLFWPEPARKNRR